MTPRQKWRFVREHRLLLLPIASIVLVLLVRCALPVSVFVLSLFAFIVWTLIGALGAIADLLWPLKEETAKSGSAEQDKFHSPAMQIQQYTEAIETDRHLTSLNWQIASIFVAGVLIGLGQVLSRNPNPPFDLSVRLIAALGVAALLAWFFLVARNRDLSAIALARARELEGRVGLLRDFHTLWQSGTVTIEGREYVASSPHGFTIVRLFVGVFVILLLLIVYL